MYDDSAPVCETGRETMMVGDWLKYFHISLYLVNFQTSVASKPMPQKCLDHHKVRGKGFISTTGTQDE